MSARKRKREGTRTKKGSERIAAAFSQHALDSGQVQLGRDSVQCSIIVHTPQPRSHRGLLLKSRIIPLQPSSSLVKQCWDARAYVGERDRERERADMGWLHTPQAAIGAA